MKLPSVKSGKKVNVKQFEARWGKGVAGLEKALAELRKDRKHVCLKVVQPLLNLSYKRQIVEKEYSLSENKLRNLDRQIHTELDKLARRVGFLNAK